MRKKPLSYNLATGDAPSLPSLPRANSANSAKGANGALEDEDPLGEAFLKLAPDVLTQTLKIEAVRALGRVLRSKHSKSAELLRAAEAILRVDTDDASGKKTTNAPTHTKSDAELLELAQGIRPQDRVKPTADSHDAGEPARTFAPTANPQAPAHPATHPATQSTRSSTAALFSDLKALRSDPEPWM